MSENQTSAPTLPAVVVPKVAPVVERNGINFTLSLTKLGKNHDKFPGLEVWVPSPTVETLGDFINWSSAKYTVQEMARAARQDALDIALDFVQVDDKDELTGFDQDGYLKALAEKFTYTSGRGAGSLSSIKDDLQSLQDANNERIQLLMNGDETVRDAIKAGLVQINELKEHVAELETEYKARAAKREATKAKKEAEAAAAKLAKANAPQTAPVHAAHAHVS